MKFVNKKVCLLFITAYLEARRHKRFKANTLQFSQAVEINIRYLNNQINSRQYKIKPSLCFIAFNPIKREIFAGDFSDRVIHHLIFEKLNRYYENIFINDCYSCRKNRGTSYGVKRANKFMRAVSYNYQRSAYVLKLDIKGYFMNIDRHILYGQNKKLIKKFFKKQPAEINEILYLLKKIIFNDPTINCKLRGKKEDWQGLPKNKSLFSASPNKGLPIGNLTSQLFGNVYLNDFDHFVKEKLKCRYYGRYVDDMIFMHQDKEYLKAIIPKIEFYLKKNLALEIHPKKIYLQPINHGLSFLGAFIKPYRLYPGKRIRKNIYSAFKEAARGQRSIDSLNSYLGVIKNYNSYKFRKNLFARRLGFATLNKLKAKINDDYTKIIPQK